MSLTLIESSPGLQIKRDVNFSNLTLNCDPRLIVPNTAGNQATGIFKHAIAGKMAAAVDICDLDVRNLTVHGKLSSLGIHDIELCNIVCDGNFSVSATGNISETAGTTITLTSGAASDITLSSGNDITNTATGNISETAVTGITLTSTGAASDIALSSGNNITLTGVAGSITETAETTITLTTGIGNVSLVSGRDIALTGRDITSTATGDITLTTGRADIKLTTAADGNIYIGSIARTSNIGFFGQTPTIQQTPATIDVAGIITALQNLGLFAP